MIRWQEPILWPSVLAIVPAHYQPITDTDTARERMSSVLGSHSRRPLYMTLWDTCVALGWQQSGLIVTNLDVLTDACGCPSNYVPKRWAEFCRNQMIWILVPGKLYPHPAGTGVGLRSRVYLAIQPEGQAC